MKPTYSISAGAFSASNTDGKGGLRALVVRREMDVPADALDLDFALDPSIAPGAEITVKLGYEGGTASEVFKGKVSAILPGINGVIVRALGKAHALLISYTAATYEGKTIGDIAKALISEAGLSAGTVTAGGKLPRYFVDARQSVYAHLRQLAARVGVEVYADVTGKIMFHAPTVTTATTSFIYAEDLLEAVGHTTNALVGKITVGGESPMSKEGEKKAHWLTTDDSSVQKSEGKGKPKLLYSDPAARTTDHAAEFAKGRLAVATRRGKRVSATILGKPDLDLGKVIAVKGVPDSLKDATGYLIAIRHELSPVTGFVTHLTLVVP